MFDGLRQNIKSFLSLKSSRNILLIRHGLIEANIKGKNMIIIIIDSRYNYWLNKRATSSPRSKINKVFIRRIKRY